MEYNIIITKKRWYQLYKKYAKRWNKILNINDNEEIKYFISNEINHITKYALGCALIYERTIILNLNVINELFKHKKKINQNVPIEKYVTSTITHETIHIVLDKTVNSAASKQFDNIATKLECEGYI